MEKKNLQLSYSKIGAICIAVSSVIYLIDDLLRQTVSEPIFDYVLDISIIIFSLFLFSKKKFGMLISLSIYIIDRTFCLFYYSYIWNLWHLLPYLGLIVIIILSSKKNQIINKIWFIPATICLVTNCVARSLYGDFFEDFDAFLSCFNLINFRWFSIAYISPILRIVGLFFAGLSFTNLSLGNVTSFFHQNPKPNTSSFSQPVQSSVIGSAEQIKMYKELLDQDIITKEEFEEKKKQVLNR